jgi:hypothetical protein
MRRPYEPAESMDVSPYKPGCGVAGGLAAVGRSGGDLGVGRTLPLDAFRPNRRRYSTF